MDASVWEPERSRQMGGTRRTDIVGEEVSVVDVQSGEAKGERSGLASRTRKSFDQARREKGTRTNFSE